MNSHQINRNHISSFNNGSGGNGAMGVNAYLNIHPQQSRLDESIVSLSLEDGDSMKYNDDDHDTRDHGDDNDGDINNERDDYFSNIHFASDMDTDGLDNSCVERNVPSLQQTLQLPVLWTGKPSSHPARFDDNDEYMQPLEMGDMDFSVPLEANFYNNRPLMQRNQPFNKTSDDESMEVSSLHHSRLEYKPLSPQTTSKYSNIKKSDKDNISMLSFTQDKEINGNTHPFYGGEGDQSYDKDDVHANEYDGIVLL